MGLVVTLTAATAGADIPRGRVLEGLQCQADPGKTYSLYLPTAYTPERRWPVLLIFPPGGSSAAPVELFRPAAEKYGWVILSSDDTRSGGVPMEVNARAVRAMGGELGTRWAADMRRVYAAGFSGGAMVAWALGMEPDLLAGVVTCGGLYLEEYFAKPLGYAHFGAVGSLDFNNRNMRNVDRRLAELGGAHRLEFFDGPHSWLPAVLAGRAIEWMEIVAMQRQLRPRDDAMITAISSFELAEAEASERSGSVLSALHRYEMIAATFAGLADVSTAAAHVARLERSPEVRRALRDEEREESFEVEYTKAVGRTFSRLKDREAPMPVARLASDLRIAELEKAAAKDDSHALTARRMLHAVLFHITSQVFGDLRAARRYLDAVAVMELAARIRPDSGVIAYNLACSHALAGDADRAIAALERAVEIGFSDGQLLASDHDLDSLRGHGRFTALLARLAPRP